MDTKDSKHHKIFLGKTILWPWPLSTFEENLNECQNWPFFRSEKLWIDLLSFKGILYNLVCKLTLDEIGIDTKPTL